MKRNNMKLMAIASLVVAMDANAAEGIYNASNTYAITALAFNDSSKVGDSRLLNGGIRRTVKGSSAVYMPETTSRSMMIRYYVIDSKPAGRVILVAANNPWYFKASSSLAKKSIDAITAHDLKEAASSASNKINVAITSACDAGEPCIFSVEVGATMKNNISITEIAQ